MRYGMCLKMEQTEEIRYAAQCGYDYIELRFGNFVLDSDEKIAEAKALFDELGIKCEAVNCFMPNHLPVTGENVDYEGIKEWVDTGMRRAKDFGVKVVVFGSQGARNIKDGFSYAEGIRQMIYFLGEIVSPIAEKYGMKVVTEPLRPEDCNMINTVKEGVMLAAAANKENIGGLADIYHMVYAGDTYKDIEECAGSVFHVHISYPVERDGMGRSFMRSTDEYDYKGFIDAAKKAGAERCSIEAGSADYKKYAPIALKVLRELD